MSYYGPASESSPKGETLASNDRLPQYDYSQHCEHSYTLMDRAGHFNRLNKRLRKTVRVVPWRDEWELEAVGKALLSVLEYDGADWTPADPQEPPRTEMCPEEAFAMISVWNSRLASLGGLPHAVESTAALAQVYWRDSLRRSRRASRTKTIAPNHGNGVSVMELRLAYSAAITRCINGFADSLQQQRTLAASVSSLCGQLGIPSWLVDARHESSHNALPGIEVLRLSASTLLEFMKVEFWIPRCTKWDDNNNGNSGGSMATMETARGTAGSHESENHIPNNGCSNISHDEGNSSSARNGNSGQQPIDRLVQYKACASAWATTRSNGARNDDSNAAPPTQSKQKKKRPSMPPKTTILPYDPLFGEEGILSSSDEEGDDDAKEELNLDKPVVNSIWGSSIGTNTNRYLLLDIPKKKKKKGKDKKNKGKPIQNVPKKRKGEKSPNDCAKLFVQSVSSPQEGYAIAVRYLVWGGVGGAPAERGVLIPGSEVAFPATPQGVSNCWQRYSPLIHVITRTWPGFAACILTHLVDFVLSIEDSSAVCENESLDAGSIRKLYFLYAWIRLILSQRFMAALDRNFSVKTTTTKNSNPLDLPLAHLDHLESLGYPLNSLLDRCRRCNSEKHDNSNGENGDASGRSFVNNSDSMGTSRDIVRDLESILGAKVSPNFGYSDNTFVPSNTNNTVEPNPLSRSTENDDSINIQVEHAKTSGEMSLDEMEAMLLSEDNNNNGQEGAKAEHPPTASHLEDAMKATYMTSGTSAGACMEMAEQQRQVDLNMRRPAWIRCQRWDECAIGTLPGYPTCPSSSFRVATESNTFLFAETSPSDATADKKKPMTPKEVEAQLKARRELGEASTHPKIFSDDLLDDMKEILLILEKRIQEGPGSIGAAEVDNFVGMSKNVLDEMKQKEYERLEDAKSPPAEPSPAATAAVSTPAPVIPTSEAIAASGKNESPEDDEFFNPDDMSEGPGYSPDGGQGSIPKDTTNTYVIPGMDEMSPEEYQKALQKSIIDRQSVRKSSGTYGNRNTWDYLNGLSGGTDPVVLKQDEDNLEN
ncbi:unnamed protein product [Pseudo-nitzschia multistriata]|uniref:Uncharacterized protein n=1 Tax=Pseudo-nitzschia multistriata TaxID=183589 RepID=A0A448Z2N6_9STRA|nr:unnamed protein product [Pseudo-nitzschia multistriata]